MARFATLRSRLGGGRSPPWRFDLLRWGIGFPAGLSIFWAYPRMPLADVYAILFAAPRFTTALLAPGLAETVGRRRWSVLLVRFVGILVILRPGSGPLGRATLAALFGALLDACAMLLLPRAAAMRWKPSASAAMLQV